jgi:hypothetical protein
MPDRGTDPLWPLWPNPFVNEAQCVGDRSFVRFQSTHLRGRARAITLPATPRAVRGL